MGAGDKHPPAGLDELLSSLGVKEEPDGADPAPEAAPSEAARMLETDFMQARLEQALAALTDVPVHIASLKAKAVMSRKTVRSTCYVVEYALDLALESGQRSCRILATAPVDEDARSPALAEALRAAEGVVRVEPFRCLSGYIPELRMAFHFVPVDPDMPGLLDLSGPACAGVLAPHLPECRGGVPITSVESELRHYKPSNRAVVRMTVHFEAAGTERSVYAKVFSDERGAESYRNLKALWDAARLSHTLHVPEPLGYDAERHILIMAEAPGRCALADWVRCLEAGAALPEGVDLARVRRCLTVVAQALHEFQSASVSIGARRTFQGELEDLGKNLRILVQRNAELAGHLTGVLAALVDARPASEPMVPSHGAFRHKQLVGDERCLTVIDWDDLGLANAALDPATFLCRLRQEPIRCPGTADEMEGLAGHFREEFLRRTPAAAAHMRAYEALAITREAVRDLQRKGQKGKHIDEIRNQLEAARALLKG